MGWRGYNPAALSMPDSSSALTRTCTFHLEGVLIARFLPGAEVSVDDARENLAVTARFAAGRPLPVLVDLRGIRSQTAEARALFAGPAAADVSIAVALLIDSPVSRVVGNFFLGFNRPLTATRLFTDEAEARTWLTTFLRQA
jgi:hypothetical protein